MTPTPRWLEKRIADSLGYFWLPCPICGRMMSGREWDGRAWHDASDLGTGQGFCNAHPYRDLVRWKGRLYDRNDGWSDPLADEYSWSWYPKPGSRPTDLYLNEHAHPLGQTP